MATSEHARYNAELYRIQQPDSVRLGAEAAHSLGCVIFPVLPLRAGAELHIVLPLILEDAAGSL